MTLVMRASLSSRQVGVEGVVLFSSDADGEADVR